MTGVVGAMHYQVDVGDGLRLHVERAGHGPPVMLLHGFTGATETWEPLAAALRDRFTTIAVDLPGHGSSGAPADPARYRLDRVADDLARVLDVLGISAAIVLGYSMGGRTALRFALRHPERVTALVLESTSPGIEDPRERDARLLADRALADDIERDGIEAFVDRWERLPLWDTQMALSPAVQEALRAQRLRNDPRGLANSLRGASAGADVPLAAGDLAPVPVLLIAGALDGKYVALAHRMAALLAHARLVVVPGAGHAVHLEQPAAFGEAVSAFLAGAATG